MKLLSTLICICLSTSALAGPVERVTVFADRAEVTRSSSAKCKGGKASVRFGNLPDKLDVRTLRASASLGATALGTSSRSITLDRIPDEKAATLEAQKAAVEARLAVLASEHAVEAQRTDTLMGYQAYFESVMGEKIRNAKPDIGGLRKAMGVFDQERHKSLVASHKREIKRRQLRRRLKAINIEISHFYPGGNRQVKVVDVSVRCGASKTPKVWLSYLVPGATWQPEYDLKFRVKGRGKVGKGAASLNVSAVIRQSTGEDWDNARITLSTSKPQLASRAPEPETILVKGHQGNTEKTLVQATENRDQLRGAAGTVNNGAKNAQIDDGGQSFTLKLPGKVTIRSDGRPYWIPVDSHTFKAVSKLVATPVLSPYVFQVAQFTNPTPYPLVAGRMNIHRAGTFIGVTPLGYTAPGEPMEITLGIDQEIRLSRTNLRRINRSPGFLSSTKKIEHGYRIALENRSGSRLRVELRERIPVSKTEKVGVQIQEKTSGDYTLDRHRGFVTWTVPLKKEQKATRDLFFSIQLPEEWKVGS